MCSGVRGLLQYMCDLDHLNLDDHTYWADAEGDYLQARNAPPSSAAHINAYRNFRAEWWSPQAGWHGASVSGTEQDIARHVMKVEVHWPLSTRMSLVPSHVHLADEHVDT